MQSIRNVTLVAYASHLDHPTPLGLESLCLQTDLVINLVLAADHSDFLPEVAAALRITDGVISGPNLPALRMAVAEQVKVALYLEIDLAQENEYERLLRDIAAVNAAVYKLDIEADDVVVECGRSAFAMKSAEEFEHCLRRLLSGDLLPAREALLDAIARLPNSKAAEARTRAFCDDVVLRNPQGPLVR